MMPQDSPELRNGEGIGIKRRLKIRPMSYDSRGRHPRGKHPRRSKKSVEECG
jgi:hypothetical protein